MKSPVHHLTLAVTLAAISLSACQTTNNKPPNIVSSFQTDRSGTIYFESWSPYVPRDAFNTPKGEREKVVVSGDLEIPADSASNKVPAMVIAHGSGGPKATNDEWIERLNAAGIATFELDSFSGRDVDETVGNQSRVRHTMMVSDAFQALKLLATHPRINRDNIGIMGFSKGGTVSQFTMWEPRRQSEIDSDLRFALHMPIYPACANFDEFAPTGAPIMMMLGGRDNWTSPKPCLAFINKLQDGGYPANAVVFEDAYHGFDSKRDGVRTVRGAWSTVDCDFMVGADGGMYEGKSNLPMNTDSEMRRAMRTCANKGRVKVGSNEALRERVFDRGMAFVRKHLFDASF